jgi:hypothetical protein
MPRPGEPFGDDLIDVGNPATGGADDFDLDITLVDDDGSTGSDVEWSPERDQPLKGQNETADTDSEALDEAEENPINFDDPRFQEKLNAERRQREDYERQALEQQERTEYALVEAEKRNIAIQADSFRLALDGVDVRIRTTTEALKMARSDQDYAAETDLEQQLQELRQIRSQIEGNQAKLPSPDQVDHDFRRHVEQRRQQYQSQRAQSDAPRALNSKAEQWQKVNSWMSDASRAKERAALIEINNALVTEGYDANKDEFFGELSRRMARRFPGLGVKSLQGQSSSNAQQRSAQRPSGAPPVASSRSSAPPNPQGQKAKRGSVQLDASDIRMMRNLRLDPTDKQAQAYFARQKYERLQNEQRAKR